MLHRKQTVVVFKDGIGQCSRIRSSVILPLVLFIVAAALAAGNVYLYRYYQNQQSMERLLSQSEKTVNEQKAQLLSLASKLKNLEKDLTRIRSFDSKLRVMVDGEVGQTQQPSSMGGPESSDFTKNYLSMYRQELLARKMHSFLDQMATEARLTEIGQQELLELMRRRQDMLASTPSIWPTEGWISSSFGYRTSPFTGRRELHKGIDISSPLGTPIYAPAKGTITEAGREGSYGLAVSMDHGAGLSTRFAHMHKVAVKSGQQVTRGELIGYVGNTGRSTGPHLHYEVRLNGVPVNPLRYILN